MKFFLNPLKLLFIASCLILGSCSDNAEDAINPNDTTKSSNIIIVPENEVMYLDSQFEEDYEMQNLEYDSTREAYIDVDSNEFFIPIQEGYVLNFRQPKNGVKNPVKEIGGGIKYKIARKNPRSNPNKCQGDCKCGIGFRCGNEKYVYVKSNFVESFNFEDREASGKLLVDTENHFLIVRFDTVDIPWLELDNE